MNKQEFLAFSLPYGLKFKVQIEDTTIWQYYNHRSDGFPILRKLDEINDEIEHNGEKFVPIEKLFEIATKNEYVLYEFTIYAHIDRVPLFAIMKLIEWHFDVAGLIENGEAIDVNTLEINPYKFAK